MSTDKENSKNGDMEVEEASSEETPSTPESKPVADSKESEVTHGKNKDKDSIKKKTKAKETKKEIKDEDNNDGKVGKEEKEGSESEEDEEEEDEDDDDDGKVPLLDQPLELSGTRERKKVQRFTEEYKTEAKDSTSLEIPEGRGTPLGSIGNIEANIQKCKADQLKPLFKVLFNRVGKLSLVKKYVRKFNGFDFDEQSEQFAKKKQVILKLESKVLKNICSILGLKKSSKREELVEQILQFLMKPEGIEKPVKQAQQKRGSRTNKSYSESEEEERRPQPRRGKMKRSNLKEISTDEEDLEDGKNEKDSDEENDKGPKKEGKRKDSDEDDELDDAEDEDNDDGTSSDGSEDPKSKRGKGSKSTKKNNKPVKKANSKKTPAKKPEKKSAPKKRVKSDDESSEDEPLLKKAKAPPTDEEIKNYVKQILEGANLEETTMKIVCRQVYSHYPEFDLAHKKDFIKTTVKSLISP